VTVIVAGAGMAGLVAGARLREFGVPAVVREKGTRGGGSMLLSSCVIWRHREWADFRRECPGGDARLQRLIWERLDESIEWLMSLGATPVWDETGNAMTKGKRFDPRTLTALLAQRAGEVEISSGAGVHQPGPNALILATGGFSASSELVGRYISPAAPLRLRANPWSTGDGLLYALDRGAAVTSGMDEFYGRNMPDAPWGEDEFVTASQLYGRFARIFDETGEEFFRRDAVSWSETNVVQATSRRPGARAYYLLDEKALAERIRDRTVAGIVETAPPESRVPLSDLPFDPPPGTIVAVRVVASITHTIGGLRVDDRARVLRDDGTAIDGLYAAGVDAGGISTGGYASGLAQALVLGLAAAEDLASRAA
jgi:succinate dehydrogenase/fumarate reductase flavoprotein subunit